MRPLCATLSLLAACGSPTSPAPIEHVIVVSIDGMVPATYAEPDAHQLAVPTLRGIAAAGAWSDGVLSVLPSVTYPAHTSIATGQPPVIHGITTNQAWDPLNRNQDGWRWYAEEIAATPIWQVAERAGLTTALVGWPVTVGAQVDWLVPEYWRAGTGDDLRLLRALSTPGLLDAVASSYPDFWARLSGPQPADSALIDVAVQLIEEQRPNLLMVHVFMVDEMQHQHGLWSEPARAALEEADRQIGRVIAAARHAGIWSRTALLVVSDHGFAPVEREIRPGALLADRGWVRPAVGGGGKLDEWSATVSANGGLAYVYLAEREQGRAAELEQLFAPLAGARESGIARLLDREEIARLGGDPRAVFALEAAPGAAFAEAYDGALSRPAQMAATHGWSPERSEMRASLLACGPALVPDRIEQGALVDVAATVAGWLRLEWPAGAGKPFPIRLEAEGRR